MASGFHPRAMDGPSPLATPRTMSQARHIYQFLARSANTAADDALLLSLPRAEEPYRSLLLDTLLERAQPPALAQLLRQYHQFPPLWRNLILDQPQKLLPALWRTAQADQPQARLNALDVVAQACLLNAADLVALLLRDPDPQVHQRAGAVLLDLARACRDQQPHAAPPPAHRPLAPDRSPDPQPDPQFLADRNKLLAALQTAVGGFDDHRSADALLAALLLVSATNHLFWLGRLEPYGPVGKAVRELLLESDQPELAWFCISALGHPSLRAVAARALAYHQRLDYILAAALAYHDLRNESLRAALKRVKQPRWLDDRPLPADQFSPPAAEALVALIADVEAPPPAKLAHLITLAHAAAPRAALRAVAALARLDKPLALKALLRLACSAREPVALAAAAHLSRLDRPRARRLAVALLSSPHPRLRRWAARAVGDFAFAQYWENFDRLPHSQRLYVGRALFKIGPLALQRLHERARSPEPAQRLRAIRIARLARQVQAALPLLLELARDPSPTVRSCALAALGELPQPDPQARQLLLAALADPDYRARANAVEALERLADPQLAAALLPFARHPHPRLRANALKALLRCNSPAATQNLKTMLADPRPPHRRSARWVLKQFNAASSTSPAAAPALRRPAAPTNPQSPTQTAPAGA